MAILLVVLIAVIVVLSIILVNEKIKETVPVIIEEENKVEEVSNKEEGEVFAIDLEELPQDAVIDESRLEEITDSTVLSRLSAVIPTLTTVISSTSVMNAAESGMLYKAVLQSGAELAKSNQLSGAYAPFALGENGKILEQAKLIPQNLNSLSKAAAISSVMSIASFVVGQHYMQQIDKKLGEISKSIDKIAKFQENEYKSKVYALTVQVSEMRNFFTDIIDNQEVRLIKLISLEDQKNKCMELLGQANSTIIDNYSEKNYKNCKDYLFELNEIEMWYEYQNILLSILAKISELQYVIYLGSVSREYCYSSLNKYERITEDANKALRDYHERIKEQFSIDYDQANFKKKILGKIVTLNSSIDNKKIELIKNQIEMKPIETDKTELFSKDVDIIVKNGKAYYLPPNATY